MKLISIEKIAGVGYEVKVTTGRWFWKRTRTFIGVGTVWREIPGGLRPNIQLEREIADEVWLHEQGFKLYGG